MTETLLQNAELVPTLFDGTARYSQSISLNGVTYIMLFDWNDRDKHWYFSLTDEDGQPIKGYMSRKLVVNWPVSPWSTDTGRPTGFLYTASTKHADPVLDTLGLDILLMYYY
jgi:hypothetical protein